MEGARVYKVLGFDTSRVRPSILSSGIPGFRFSKLRVEDFMGFLPPAQLTASHRRELV